MPDPHSPPGGPFRDPAAPPAPPRSRAFVRSLEASIPPPPPSPSAQVSVAAGVIGVATLVIGLLVATVMLVSVALAVWITHPV